MDLTRILMDQLGNGGLEMLGQQTGLNGKQTKTAMNAMIPTLLSAMARNSSSQEGANGLLSALDRDHDGGILNDLAGFLGQPETGNGNGILKHVLGNERGQVEQGLASQLGVNAQSIGKLLPIIAPMVMAYLGREKRQASSNGFDANGIAGLLGGLAGSSRKDDGLDLGDVLNLVGGLSGNNGGAGGLLGGLLKNVLKG